MQIWAVSNLPMIRTSDQWLPFTWIHILVPDRQTNGQLNNVLVKEDFTVQVFKCVNLITVAVPQNIRPLYA
jgi:hypothetical protein